MKTSKQMKGFTIIEVVLVLAIAALIFLMVFIAFPALQRSQRNTARKNAVSQVLSAVTDYMSGHQGNLPAAGNLTIANYVQEQTAAGYTISVQAVPTADISYLGTDPTDITSQKIFITPGSTCSATDGTVSAGMVRQYTVMTLLEGGTDGIPYCLQG